MELERVSHYEIQRLIGRGGMGEVYEAVDLSLNRRPVALKFIAVELSTEHESLRRFESEAFNAAKLNHPHIATIYGFEREGQRPFIAMELVSGESLRDRIRLGPLAIADALGIARDVASALALAHRHHILHRDIKPENLMFDQHGAIKVMDFGLARGLLASRITVTGSSLGTPAYMAPEAIQGSACPASDIFALGLVLHEMLTGKQVYDGDNFMTVMYAIANSEPPSVRLLRPEVSEEIDQVLSVMLARDPARRPLADDVTRELSSLTGITPPSGRFATDRRLGPVFDRRRSHLPRWLLVGILAISVGVLSYYFMRFSVQRHEEAVLLNNQGRTAANTGNLLAAQELFVRALQREPHYGEAMMNLGAIYRLKGQADSATLLYQRVIQGQRKNRKLTAQAYYNLADLDMTAGAWPSAVADLERSVAADTTNPAYPNNLGLALVMVGRAEDALTLLERQARRFPTYAFLWKNAGFAALQLGRNSMAAGYLDRALELDSRLLDARGLRAQARARTGDHQGALADWTTFAAGAPAPELKDRVERELLERGILEEGTGGHPPSISRHPRR